MARYRTVSLTELKPGSVLATPVFDVRNVKLLDSGTTVSQHLLDRLKEFGIADVLIQSTTARIVSPPSTPKPLKPANEAPIDRCPCGTIISIPAPTYESQATAWICNSCGAVYFGGEGEGVESLGVSKADPSVRNPFSIDSNAPSIPPANVQRLVKALARGEYQGDDRRRHKRYQISVPVVAIALGADFSIKEQPVKMTTANVSLGGAALIHTRYIRDPYLALDFTVAGIELMQVVLKVLRVHSIGVVYEVAGEFISQVAQRP